MKILITTDWYQPVVNGVVTSVLNLSAGLKQKGHEVMILTLSQNCYSYKKNNVIYLGSLNAGYVYPDARIKIPMSDKWMKELLDWKPDIIHSQCEFSTFFIAKKIAGILNIPMVHTYHTIYEDYTHYFSSGKKWAKDMVKLFTRRLAGQVSAIIAPTEKIRTLLYEYKVCCNVDVIPTGIHLEQYESINREIWKKEIRNRLRIPAQKKVLLYAGRLAKEKNIEELLHFQKKAEKYNTVLLLVGGGPYRESLQKEVREKRMKGSVIFTGMVPPDQMRQYYQAGDLFVSASTSETQGMTYIEALASGIPLLCRKDKCLKGLINNGVNGWQYENERGFMDKLKTYINLSESEKNILCSEAEKSVNKFSIQNFTESVEKVYLREIIRFSFQNGNPVIYGKRNINVL